MVVPVQDPLARPHAGQRQGGHGAGPPDAGRGLEDAALGLVVPQRGAGAGAVQEGQAVQTRHVELAAQARLVVAVRDARAIRHAVIRGRGRGDGARARHRHLHHRADGAGGHGGLEAGGGGELAGLGGVVPDQGGGTGPVGEDDLVDAGDVEVAAGAGLVVGVGQPRA